MISARHAWLSLGLILAGGAAHAGPTLPPDPPREYLWDDWPTVARSKDGDCTLTITSNGNFMIFRATGFEPGEGFRVGVTNATMKPIDTWARADSQGGWEIYYAPKLWSNVDSSIRTKIPSGTVNVNLSASSCRLSASVPWQRAIRVIR